MALETNTPPPVSAAAVAAQRPGEVPETHGWISRYVPGILPLLAMLLAAALAGAGAALLVARATGWGTETVVRQYVTDGGSVTDRPPNIKALLAAALPAVVAVKSTTTQSNPFLAPSGGGRVMAQGTGVVIGSSGEVITNAHLVTGVISGASSVTVTFADSGEHPARIVGTDCENDLALLRVEGVKNVPVLELGDSASVEVGDAAVAVGYALGLDGGPSVTTGIISATDRTSVMETGLGSSCTLTGLLQTDASISSGDSGGALLNDRGQVIGINTMVAASTPQAEANGISFAIASNTVESLLSRLRAGG